MMVEPSVGPIFFKKVCLESMLTDAHMPVGAHVSSARPDDTYLPPSLVGCKLETKY